MRETIVPKIRAQYRRYTSLMLAAMLWLAREEAMVVWREVRRLQPGSLLTTLPDPATLKETLEDTPFPVTPNPGDRALVGAAWWALLGEQFADRITQTLREGVTQGETLEQIQARLQGTQRQDFEDGVAARARHAVQWLLTTQITHALTQAHEALGQANPQAGMILRHSSILDSRTSTICLARHGLTFDAVTHAPIGHTLPYLGGTPYHPNCRSHMALLFADGGPVEQENLTAFLQRQTVTFQDELLGPSRAQAFRAGALTPAQLLDAATGQPLTLAELGLPRV